MTQQKLNLTVLAILSFLMMYSCKPSQQLQKAQAPTLEEQYKTALRFSAFPSGNTPHNNLIVISESNTNLVWKTIKGEQYILVTSWKDDTTYYKNDPVTGFYNTQKWPIWVTAVPELKDKCATLGINDQNRDLRLKQLMGMPVSTNKNYFIQFWVRPQDLFRPCPDADIDDKQCELCFQEGVSEEHKAWVENQRNASYYNCKLDDNYPWTQLGYTYDWNINNTSHIGLSEFVIGANKNIVIEGFYSTKEYCK